MGKISLVWSLLVVSSLLLDPASAVPASASTGVNWAAKTETISLGKGWPTYKGSISVASQVQNTTKGTTEAAVSFFAGLPYAQPPLGRLRFMAPQPLQPAADAQEGDTTEAVVDAMGWGDGSNVTCIQQPAFVGLGTEDCLKINIWKPTVAKEGDKLPVIVYIHGGGFYAGSPVGFPLDTWVSQHLAQTGQGIVAASISYRLNLLGFVGGRIVRDWNAPEINSTILNSDQGDLSTQGALNRGLLDQREALRWVQQHIARFGGDSEQVTIVGESAGGASVVMQLTGYGGIEPAPFKRVIAHSIGYQQMPDMDLAQERFETAAAAMGCSLSTTDDGSSSAASVMECLSDAPLEALVAGINSVAANGFCPQIEADNPEEEARPVAAANTFLPALPSVLLQTGRFSRGVQFIGGHTIHDGRTFANGRPTDFVTEDDIRRVVFGKRWPAISNETITEGLKLYPPASFDSVYDRAWHVAGDVVFTCMDWFAAKQVTKFNSKENPSMPSFLFRWNAPNPVLYQANPYQGVMHTSDLYFLFSGSTSVPNATYTFTPFNETEQLLANEATSFWTSLVSTGDPNTYKLPNSPLWADAFPSLSSQDSGSKDVFGMGRRMVLTQDIDDPLANSTRSSMEGLEQTLEERCSFWMSRDVTRESGV